MPLLVIVRHGQSSYNLENRFTGDVDIELTPLGEVEAKNAGILLTSFVFQRGFTSTLQRSIHTMNIILAENKNPAPPVVRSAALNERRYGDLQGLNKTETELKYGEAQVLEWRRSFAMRPPGGESLKDAYDRVVPYYLENIEPGLRNNENSLVVAHGNSLRALMMHLENLTEEEILRTNLATGIPRRYELDAQLKPVKIEYVLPPVGEKEIL